MSRKTKPSEKVMDLLMELSSYSWKFGAAVSIVFLFLSGITYRWANTYNQPSSDSPLSQGFIESFGWMVYSIPLMLFGIACLFAWRAILTYSKEA